MQRARGNLEAALKAYQDSLAIREKLAAQDPSNTEWQRDLSVSFNKIGDVQRARGNLDAALKAYQDSLAIAEKLAAQDPSNTEWQRDLSVSFNKIGDVQSARGNLDAALKAYQDSARHRARSSPRRTRATAEWQRDLSVSFNKIGDVQSARGNLDAALKAYQDSLAIAEKLAAQDPSNTEWQRDLSVSFEQDRRRAERAGQSRRRAQGLPGQARHRREAGRAGPEQHRVAARPLGQLRQHRRRAEARGAISTPRSRPTRTALEIQREARRAGPSNAGWQRDLSVSMYRLAIMEGSGVSWAEVLARMEAMKARGVLLPKDEPLLEQARAHQAATTQQSAGPAPDPAASAAGALTDGEPA